MRKFRLSVLALGLVGVVCADAANQPAAAGAQQRKPTTNALRVQRVGIMDTSGFDRPLVASFLFIPVGWKAQGGVVWGGQYLCTNGYNISWGASSPDNTQLVGILPQAAWSASNIPGAQPNPGCKLMNITSLQAYLQQYIPTLKPGARVLDFRPRRDLMAKLQSLNTTIPSAMGEFRTWIESVDALFSFNDNGRDMRGVITATAYFSGSHTYPMYGMQAMDSLSVMVYPMYVATAPNGQLNIGFAEAIRQSILPNPEWTARIAAHNGKIGQEALAEGVKRGKIIQEANDYISKLRTDTYNQTSAVNDRIARDRGNAMRDVQDFNDPSAAGGRVQLSSFYDHAWKLNDGTYVLSNDASFDPWRDLNLAGTRLDQSR
ncbi:MAG: hypothetical protein ABIT36_06580 [Steroidobacteraceae bacterium]